MRVFGGLLMLGGVILVLFGLAYDIAAPGTTTINLGLVNERSIIVNLGGFAFLAGAVFVGCGVANVAIQRKPSDDSEAATRRNLRWAILERYDADIVRGLISLKDCGSAEIDKFKKIYDVVRDKSQI